MANQQCWMCNSAFDNVNLSTRLDIDKTVLVQCPHCGVINILIPQPHLCFYCHKDLYVAEDFEGDIRCPHCQVENQIFKTIEEHNTNPADCKEQDTCEDWLNQESEEEMPFDKPEKNYLSLPKVGEEYDFSQHGAITEIKKVEGKKGFNFTKKESLVLPDGTTATVDKDLGYHYVIVFEDGKMLSVSSWKPYYAMEEAGLIENVKFQLKHPTKGEWVCLIV